METIKTDTLSLRKFALIFTAFLCVVGTIMLLKHKAGYYWYYKAGLLFVLTGLLIPAVLKPLYVLWMKLSFIIGWVNTRAILLLIFYLLFAPIGIIMRLLRVDLLDRKIMKDKQTYWKDKTRQSPDVSGYERQF